MEEHEIDLRPLIRALLRGWRLILVCALAAGLIAGLRAWQREPVYTAQAQIAVVRLQTEVDFESNIRQYESDNTDITALRGGLVSVARSGTIAQDVITSLGDTLPAHLRDTGTLQSMVTVDSQGNTNIIQIRVSGESPEIAEALVNAWARSFVRLANATFGAQTKSSDLEDQLAQARQQFEATQGQLATSELPRELSRLERQTSDLGSLLTTLRTTQLSGITNTLMAQGDQQADLLASYGTAYWSGQTVPLDAERKSKVDELDTLYKTAARLRLLRDDVHALRDQVQIGSTIGSGFEYSLLKAQLFAGSTELPSSVQVQAATERSEAPTVAELDALLNTIEERLNAVDTQIRELAAAFRSGDAYALPAPTGDKEATQAFERQLDDFMEQRDTISLLSSLVVSETGALVSDSRLETYEDKYQDMLADLEQKEGQVYVLEQERDLAKANYTALSTRVSELQAAAVGDDTVVRLADEGVLTGVTQPSSRDAVLAFVAGLILSALFVLFRAIMPALLMEPNVPVPHQRVISSE